MLGRLARCQGGVSALEFALIAPVLVVLVLAGFQVVEYVNAVRKIQLVASSISDMITETPPPSVGATTATVNALDVHFSSNSALVLFPYLMKDGPANGTTWSQDITINYASVQFASTGATCPGQDQSACYVASVVWTSNALGLNNARPCLIPQLAADDTAAPSPHTLPRSLFGPGSAVVIDVIFTFRPTFATSLMRPMTIRRSIYMPPRYVDLINFDTTGNDGAASKCLGY